MEGKKGQESQELSPDNNGHAATSDRAKAVVQKVKERERAPAAAGEEGGGAGVSVERQVAPLLRHRCISRLMLVAMAEDKE